MPLAAVTLIPHLLAAGLPPIPPATNAPGAPQILILLGALAFYAVCALFVGMLAGAAAWWGGLKGNNYGMASIGRSAVIGSVFGLILVGASVAIANYALNLGLAVKP
jgi:hypothetical protein